MCGHANGSEQLLIARVGPLLRVLLDQLLYPFIGSVYYRHGGGGGGGGG